MAVDDRVDVLAGSFAKISVTDNDVDLGGDLDPSTVRVTIPPSNGAAAAQGDGVIVYEPSTGFVGNDSFEYQVAERAAGRLPLRWSLSRSVAQSQVHLEHDVLTGAETAPT